MTADEYHRLLTDKIKARDDLTFAMFPLNYQAGKWELMRIVSKKIGKDDKVVVIRGTIHGDEIAGALTILNYFDELVDCAHEKGIKLIIYPLGNPSGFEKGIRYNADNDKGEGNNDFLRYEMADGSYEGDLGSGKPFKRWLMSDSPELSVHLPLEAKVIQELVRKDPLDQVAAALDLHQDYITPG
ncbi:MAG: succinylglutamate desuccinylase/aspartoacylase family protein, partial [Microgenomates group bacterium]